MIYLFLSQMTNYNYLCFDDIDRLAEYAKTKDIKVITIGDYSTAFSINLDDESFSIESGSYMSDLAKTICNRHVDPPDGDDTHGLFTRFFKNIMSIKSINEIHISGKEMSLNISSDDEVVRTDDIYDLIIKCPSNINKIVVYEPIVCMTNITISDKMRDRLVTINDEADEANEAEDADEILISS